MVSKKKARSIFSRYWIVVVVGIVLVVFFVLRQVDSGSTAQPTTLTQIFKSSDVMDFTVDVPDGYSIEESVGSVSLSSKNGDINIGKNSTNFDNLGDYIFYSRNNLKENLTEREDIVVNDLDAVSGFVDGRKLYLIYVESRVYIISTDSPALYDDLDQIAQSFRYTPE